MFQINKCNLKSMSTTWLFMCYPFRSENDFNSGNPPTYANKLRESNVIELVNQNHLKVKPFETIVNDAFERFNLVLETNMDPFGQPENDETYDQQSQQLEESDTAHRTNICSWNICGTFP